MLEASPILEVRSRNYPLSCSSYSLWVLSKEEGALPLKHYGALGSLERFCTSVLHSAWKLSVKSVFSQGLLFKRCPAIQYFKLISKVKMICSFSWAENSPLTAFFATYSKNPRAGVAKLLKQLRFRSTAVQIRKHPCCTTF